MAGLVTGAKRPRNLTHWHAGPLLFGDWGTSRLYVLGIAAVTLGLAAPYYLLALSVLMVLVAWAYTIVCRSFQDGGGVYSAARQISPLLSVIGATLLFADYTVTASLSMVEAMAYFGLPSEKWLVVGLCALVIGVLFAINWFGAKSAGEFAKWIAVASLVLSAIVAVFVLPWVPEGLRQMRMDNDPWLTRWVNFTGIILALSGVEAVANMTGIMKEPVSKTSKKTIWPVLGEVAVLNMVFGIALIGLIGLTAKDLPSMTNDAMVHIAGHDYSKEEVRGHAMKILAIEGGQKMFGETTGFVFGKVTAIVFGLLLISAANTVIGGIVSVLYALGRDGEMPSRLTKLNYSGMPTLPLIVACVCPVILLCFYYELEPLSHLYAIGVTGAIALNLSCCAINRRLAVTKLERAGLWTVAGILTAVFVTIAVTKLNAAIFCGGLIVLVLGVRWGFKRYTARAAALAAQLPVPEIGWLAEVQRAPLEIDASKPRIMLAARGRYQAEYAVDQARKRGATLFAIYIRTLRVVGAGALTTPRLEDDVDAQESLGTVAVIARRYQVPFVPIYIVSPDISEEILDYTVTFGCDTLIMGKTQRSQVARSLEGDVVSQVAALLPDGVSLVTRDASPYVIGPMPSETVITRKDRDREAGDEDEGGHA
jgi:amino acid transporter/nucleotide-binding universal stress UspA family protein